MSNLLTDEIKAWIGKSVEYLPQEISLGDIRLWCEATYDDNPLYSDAEYARQAGFRDIVAPGSMIPCLFRSQLLKSFPFFGLDAGLKHEFLQPVYLGDKIGGRSEIKGITQKQLKRGPALLVLYQTTCWNQRGEVVVIETMPIFWFPEDQEYGG